MVRRPTLVTYTLISACLLCASNLSAGAQPEPEPVATTWKMLTYEASGMLGSSNTRIELLESSLQALQEATPGPLEKVALQQNPGQIVVMDIQATGKAIGKKHQSSVRIWFDAATGAVFLRDKLRSGSDPYRKAYRFAENRASRVKQQPVSRNETDKPVQQWSKIKNSSYPYDLDNSGCDTVTDPAVLLYLLSVERSTPPPARCVFFDDTLYKVSFIDDGEAQLAVSYSDHTDTNNRRDIEDSRTTRHYRLAVSVLTPDTDSSDFEFFELRGNIVVTMDLETGIPLQLAGDRAGVGRITIPVTVLQRRTLASSDRRQ